MFGVTHDNVLPLSLKDQALKCVNNEKHVGNMLSNIGDIVNYLEIMNKIAVNTNSISRIFKCLDWNSKSTLFNSKCCSLYGIELIDISSMQFQRFQIQWRKSARYALSLHPRTHGDLLPPLVGRPALEYQAYSRILCFYHKGWNHRSGLISFFFKNALCEMHSYMGRNINIIKRKLNISLDDIISRSDRWIKMRCKGPDISDWRTNLLRELLMCRDGTLQNQLTEAELKELIDTVCID